MTEAGGSLSALTPVLDGRLRLLESELEGLSRGDRSPLARIEGTHFARWAIVPYLEYRDGTPRDSTSYLLFTSWFDGSVEAYLGSLAQEMPGEADRIWRHCVDYPGLEDPPAFQRYLLRHRIKPGFPFAAYPGVPVSEVKACLDLRERLAAFAVRSARLEGRALRRAWQEAFPE